MRRIAPLLVVMACVLASCQRVHQYRMPAEPQPTPEEKLPENVPVEQSWIQPREVPPDLPMVFVPSAHPDWANLPRFWNHFPPPAAGMRTVHLGLPPLQALAALALIESEEQIRIKVPLGLPDPTPHVPKSNPPTYRKWVLGKQLFFRPLLPGKYACASCHDPDHGFAQDRPSPHGGTLNTLSLINVVFNRRQFWDGRVETLEETLVRNFEDERASNAHETIGVRQHIWGGFVSALNEKETDRRPFQQAFGVPRATQDTVARALATYMRTILAGASLYDRAEQRRAGKPLTADHFRAALDDRAAEILKDGEYEQKYDRAAMPGLLMKGYELFHGTARCGKCHTGPLFTDQDYHNVGYQSEGATSPSVQETGRSVHVPIGQKEARFFGAYRTPTLRNLVKTRPYFHNGKLPTLPAVVDFFSGGIVPTQPAQALAKELRDGNGELRLDLSLEQKDALVMFLRCLEGTPVDPIVARQ